VAFVVPFFHLNFGCHTTLYVFLSRILHSSYLCAVLFFECCLAKYSTTSPNNHKF
jgi:hypothetical protein